ncbi:hypothetical protein LSH36_70g05049 [Paralvinella palmiformis]|uniref:PDZ domain-containing protein n=1 Tax=Paralvinella palmiformis TaxID=53620 RepID=A0AAD9K357_9ANNE|nr:hypothetical protein LSH36_70g05049 [Paralvinella palmiformis]
MPKFDLDTMRIVRLTRHGKESLGFTVRGGYEHEVGVYVSEVEPESQAYTQGLRAGDEIMRLNGFTISQAIHQEVLNLIKAHKELVLKVRRK